MVEEGKISASEGIFLLEAWDRRRKPARSPNRPTPNLGGSAGSPRWLRVRVTDLDTGRSKATVNCKSGSGVH